MSFSVPIKKYPIAADVNALALFLAQRQSDEGTTNGGISGTPTVPQLGVDSAGLGLSYLQAMSDALMCGMGYQGQSDISGTSNSTSSTSFVDITGFTDYSFTAPIAKTYLVHVDVSSFFSASAGFPAGVYFRGSNVTAGTFFESPNTLVQSSHLGEHCTISWRSPVVMLTGTNVLRVQWKVVAGTTTVAIDGNDKRTFTVTG